MMTPESRNIQDLLLRLPLREKIDLLSGDTSFLSGSIEMIKAYNFRPFPAGVKPEWDIPGIQFSDGPRGVVMNHSTCFPVAIARGASWDVDLEERVGDVFGIEAKALGANLFAGICVNCLRHPGWGRAQETFGEDPFHLGEMGAALVRGVQRHVMGCVKHFACNSIERSRFRVDVQASDRALHEVYLPQFKRCVDQGVVSVMTAYNRLNGSYCGENVHLIRDILKGRWAFQGFVMSDFFLGVRDGVAGMRAGLDLEMPFTWRYGRPLKRALTEGRLKESTINDAVERLLKTQFENEKRGEGRRYDKSLVASEVHRALSREAARKGMVLLKNQNPPDGTRPLLPLDLERISRIALVGPLADKANTGDIGSSRVRPPQEISPLEGLCQALGGVDVRYEEGRSLERTKLAVRDADAAIVVVGLTPKQEGEFIFYSGGDRTNLNLPVKQEELVLETVKSNPNTAVVLVGGSAILMERWRERAPAILMAWYPGMEGGHALADILLGEACPSGKLPCTFPASHEQLPPFDPRAKSVVYDLYPGYRHLDRRGHRAAFPFGFGLSYTDFKYHRLSLGAGRLGGGDTLTLSVEIENVGDQRGDEVVQLYVGYPKSQVERPVKELKAFTKLSLEPGERREVQLALPVARLAHYDENKGEWKTEATTVQVLVGPSSQTERGLRGEFQIVS